MKRYLFFFLSFLSLELLGQEFKFSAAVDFEGPVYSSIDHKYNPDYVKPKGYIIRVVSPYARDLSKLRNRLSTAINTNKPQTIIDRLEAQLELLERKSVFIVRKVTPLNNGASGKVENGVIRVSSIGPYELKFSYVDNHNAERQGTTTLEVIDKLVVCLGESYMAGEGNPDKPVKPYTNMDLECNNTILAKTLDGKKVPTFLYHTINPAYALGALFDVLTGQYVPKNYPNWQEPKAHRSEINGASLAVRNLNAPRADNKAVVVRYISFARSGGKIDLGLIKPNIDLKTDTLYQSFQGNTLDCAAPYDKRINGRCAWVRTIGVRKDEYIGVGQISEAESTLAGAKIDCLIIGIGGNDVNFAVSLEDLALDSGFWEQVTRNSQETRDVVFGKTVRLLEQLKTKFADLNTALSRLNVQKDNIMLMEYPTALFEKMDEHGTAYDGSGCGVFTNWGAGNNNSIDKADSKLFRELGTRLNKEISSACTRFGWGYVDGIQKAFAGHGYCSDKSYYVFMEESCKKQADFWGTAHPNSIGHQVYANIILSKLKPKLGL